MVGERRASVPRHHSVFQRLEEGEARFAIDLRVFRVISEPLDHAPYDSVSLCGIFLSQQSDQFVVLHADAVGFQSQR